jgi:hypothetical protein
MRNRIFILVFGFAILLAFTLEVRAQVYKYVDKDGVTHFTDSPSDPRYKSYMSKDAELQTSSIFRGCEIVSFSQHEIIKDIHGDGGGFGGTSLSVYTSKETCVNLSIRNNDRTERLLRGENIMAITKNGERKKGGGLLARIGPNKTYQGTVCFDRHLDVIERVDLVEESEKENLRKPTPPPPPKPKSENKGYRGVNTIGSSKKSVIRKDRSGRF